MPNYRFPSCLLGSILSTCLTAGPLAAQQDQDPRIQTIEVSDHVYMLVGNGGNVGLSVGDDGAFLIDDQFAPMVGQIKAAVDKVSKHPVRFLVNTHWHGDHTGGNERLGTGGALIFAHENVRKRMSVEQFMKAFDRKVPPAPDAALPVVTFTDAITFHWNGDDIRVFHVADAHTDGDAIIWFQRANVFHMGDTYFNGSYPFIDTGSGGSIKGVIAAADRVLALADDETKIIPGHGKLSDKKELMAYCAMLVTVRERVVAAIRIGNSADEVVAQKPTAEFDETLGKGFMAPEPWLRIVYDSVAREADAAGGERSEPGQDRKQDSRKQDE